MGEISNAISLLRENIEDHYRRLDSEAIWFFVATLGCWSVTDKPVQLVAIGIVFFFLLTQVFRGQEFNRSFGGRVRLLRAQIESSNLEEPSKDQLVGQLCRMSDEYLPFLKVVTRNYRFIVSCIFFSVSVVQFWNT